MADPETKIAWKEVLERFLLLLFSMSFLIAVAVAVSIFVVDSPLDLEIRAKIYVKLKQPDMAAKAYVKLTKVDPRNHEAFEALGNLYTSQEAHREASASFAKAAELHGSVSNFLNAALSAQKAGLKEEALIHYKAVLERDPNNVVAKTNLASVTPPKTVVSSIPGPESPQPTEKDREPVAEHPTQPSGPPATTDVTTGREPSQISKAEPAHKPVEPPSARSIQKCDLLLKDVKDLIGNNEPDKLALLRERIGEPLRTCESETLTTYCFKCIVRGRLTDTIEVVEKENRIAGYYFGSCGCAANGAK
ncbi:MAG: hypothetical protein HY913_00855 [Desulfomonile tiedjei]|nr:hypothetical protein [Desulfomonile tiedjei]